MERVQKTELLKVKILHPIKQAGVRTRKSQTQHFIFLLNSHFVEI